LPGRTPWFREDRDMNKMKHYLSVLACYAKLSIQGQLEYPLFLVSWAIMIPIQYFAGIWMIKMIIDQFDSLGGWSFPEIAFMFGLGLISQAIYVIFFIQTRGLEYYVTMGEFDRMLTRPMGVFFQFITHQINFIGRLDLIPGVVIYAYACHIAGFVWSLSNTIQLLLVLTGATLIRAAVFNFIGCVAFWTKRSYSLSMMGVLLFERTSVYPLTIYPMAVQWVLTFIIPISFIAFYPTCGLLGSDPGTGLPFDMTIWTVAVGAVTFGLSYLLFNYGLFKKYESAGS